MTRSRVPLWIALAGCLSSALLGAAVAPLREARAQAPGEQKPDPKTEKADEAIPSEYPYLPARFGEAYIPSVADWQALRLTALGASVTRLTENFSRQHLTCFAGPKRLTLTLDLQPLPAWKFSAPGGKFTAPAEKVKPEIQKALDANLRLVRSFFPEVRDQDMVIAVYINSERVGTWQEGALTLVGEKPAN